MKSMDRLNGIFETLMNKAKEINKVDEWQYDLEMNNGDYVTICLEGQPIIEDYKTRYNSIITDDDQIIKFDNLVDIATWINNNY